ncbi:hypothetical protein Ruko_13920 [Ruthenibacterium sp. TH_2024_36131]
MKGNPEERAIALGEYITANNATVRSAAKAFGISKSTVHKDIPKIAGTFYGKSTIFLPGGVLV